MKRPEINLFGENGLLLNWEQRIDPILHDSILSWNLEIQNKFKIDVLETVLSYNSIAIYLKTRVDRHQFKLELDRLTPSLNVNSPTVTWEFPVCYDTSFGKDLELLAKQKKHSISKIIELHTQPVYRIYFTGFLPGFLYLGGLDSSLFTNRKKTPSLNVAKGSVAIGGEQTGIYPENSPGGWQIIGRTPLTLFDPLITPPTPFLAGHKLKFKSISILEFQQIQNAVLSGTYYPKKLTNG